MKGKKILKFNCIMVKVTINKIEIKKIVTYVEKSI